jgi:hypothetical protein
MDRRFWLVVIAGAALAIGSQLVPEAARAG